MKKTDISLLVILITLVVLYCSLPMQAFAAQRWAIGEWRLVQYQTQENGREVTFSGLIRIHREHGRLSGSIYFDVVGNWEPLKDIEVNDETIRFTRPTYEQKFYGHRNGNKMNGTYRDKPTQGAWKWSAEKE